VECDGRVKTVFEHHESFPHDDGDVVIRKAYDVMDSEIKKHPEYANYRAQVTMRLNNRKTQTLIVEIKDPNGIDWRPVLRTIFWLAITVICFVYFVH
jgi:hypothetical protein